MVVSSYRAPQPDRAQQICAHTLTLDLEGRLREFESWSIASGWVVLLKGLPQAGMGEQEGRSLFSAGNQRSLFSDVCSSYQIFPAMRTPPRCFIRSVDGNLDISGHLTVLPGVGRGLGTSGM